jgi:hypothetical protein
MKKSFFFTLLIIATTTLVTAQKGSQSKTLKKVMTLKLPELEKDALPGTRGASVVWHPLQKKYYAAMSGNAGFPLAIFNEKGTVISSNDLACLKDVRGLWYNPILKRIEGNCYDDGGWFTYGLDKQGIVKNYTEIIETMNQPSSQVVGVYATKNKTVMFLDLDTIYVYKNYGDYKFIKTYSLTLGYEVAPKAENDVFYDSFDEYENYNKYTLVSTNMANMEVGLLNTVLSKIEIYSLSTGLIKKSFSFPKDATIPPLFGFAYTNGIFWLFNQDSREWVGYK